MMEKKQLRGNERGSGILHFDCGCRGFGDMDGDVDGIDNVRKMAVIAVAGGVPIAIATIGTMWGLRWLCQEAIPEIARVNQHQKADWLWDAKWWVAVVVVVLQHLRLFTAGRRRDGIPARREVFQ